MLTDSYLKFVSHCVKVYHVSSNKGMGALLYNSFAKLRDFVSRLGSAFWIYDIYKTVSLIKSSRTSLISKLLIEILSVALITGLVRIAY